MLKLSHPITSINGFKIGDRVRLKDGDGRPHIIKSFSIDSMKEFFFEVQFEDGTETMLDNIAPLTSEPSLLSNLDEAAEEYSENILANNEDLQDAIEDAYKTGGMLVAGQFQKIEGELVDWYSTSEGKDYCCGIKTSDPFVVPEGFYIRKKQ